MLAGKRMVGMDEPGFPAPLSEITVFLQKLGLDVTGGVNVDTAMSLAGTPAGRLETGLVDGKVAGPAAAEDGKRMWQETRYP